MSNTNNNAIPSQNSLKEVMQSPYFAQPRPSQDLLSQSQTPANEDTGADLQQISKQIMTQQTQDLSKKHASSERLIPADSRPLTKMASQIRLGELDKPGNNSKILHQGQDVMDDQFRRNSENLASGLQNDSRFGGFKETSRSTVAPGNHDTKKQLDDALSENQFANSQINMMGANQQYNSLLQQQFLMQQHQLYLQMQNQMKNLPGMPDDAMGFMGNQLYQLNQNAMQLGFPAPFARQIPQPGPRGSNLNGGDDFNVMSMSPLLPPGQPFFQNNIMTPRSPNLTPMDSINQQNYDQVLKYIESQKEILQEFLKMDQFQSQGTISKSIFSSQQDDGEGEISYSVSPAGQSVNNQSIFNGSSGAHSSKPKTSSNNAKDSPIKAQDLKEDRRQSARKQVTSFMEEIYAVAMSKDPLDNPTSQESPQAFDKQLSQTGKDANQPTQVEASQDQEKLNQKTKWGQILHGVIVGNLADYKEAKGVYDQMAQEQQQKEDDQLRPALNLQISSARTREGIDLFEVADVIANHSNIPEITKQDVMSVAYQVNESNFSEQVAYATFEKIIQKLQQLYLEKTKPPHFADIQIQTNIENNRKKSLVAEPNINQMQIESNMFQINSSEPTTKQLVQAQTQTSGKRSEKIKTDEDKSTVEQAMRLIEESQAHQVQMDQQVRSSDIDTSEFLMAMITEESLLTMPRMKLAFEILDHQKAKSIQIDKLKLILLNLAQKQTAGRSFIISEDSITDALTHCSKSADNKISFSEFCNLLLRLHVIFAIETSRIEQKIAEEESTLRTQKKIQFHRQLTKLIYDNTVLEIEENQINQIYEQFQHEKQSSHYLKDPTDSDPFEIRQLKYILCNIGRLHETDIDQTAYDILQDSNAQSVSMDEFLEIILKLKAICLSRSQMEEEYPSDPNTNPESNPFRNNIDKSAVPLDQSQRFMNDQSSSLILKYNQEQAEIKGKDNEPANGSESARAQPDVRIRTMKNNSSLGRINDSRESLVPSQQDANNTSMQQTQLAKPLITQNRKQTAAFGNQTNEDKESIFGKQINDIEGLNETELVNQQIQEQNHKQSLNNEEQEKHAQSQPIDTQQSNLKQESKELKITPNQTGSSDDFANLKRAQTIPAKSQVPDNVNYDEVQSCYISGMSKTPVKVNEMHQDSLHPSGTPQAADTSGYPAPQLGNARQTTAAPGLPPRVPSNQASMIQQNNSNLIDHQQVTGPNGESLPQLTPTRHVLKNSVVSRPSEKYWANFSYFSSERRELERMIGYNRSSQMSQPKVQSIDGPSKEANILTNAASLRGSVSNQLLIRNTDSDLLNDVNVFLRRSQNGSDCIVINKETGDVVDVLTQEKMFDLLKKKKAELEQLEALANQQKDAVGNKLADSRIEEVNSQVVNQEDQSHQQEQTQINQNQSQQVEEINGEQQNEQQIDEVLNHDQLQEQGVVKEDNEDELDEEYKKQVSQEVLESASYRSSGMLRSMSATNMSMPFLDKVNVQAKNTTKKANPLQLNLSNVRQPHPPNVISHHRIASTRTENLKKNNRDMLPPMGNTIQRNRVLGMNQDYLSERHPQSFRNTNMSNAANLNNQLENNLIGQQYRAGTPRAIHENYVQKNKMNYPVGDSPTQKNIVPQQDVGMIRDQNLQQTAQSEQNIGRWHELHKFNESDMILSKDFYIKDQLDNMNQISKKLGQVQSEIMSRRERNHYQPVDQMLQDDQKQHPFDQQVHVQQQPFMRARHMQQQLYQMGSGQKQQFNHPNSLNVNRLASAPFSSPSDFRFPRGNITPGQQRTGNNFASQQLLPRNFEESCLMTERRESINQSRISYDEVPLEEYFTTKIGGQEANQNKLSNAQVFMKFKGFNKQAEMEEEYIRLKREGQTLQQQNKDFNMKRNASFVRRLNEEGFALPPQQSQMSGALTNHQQRNEPLLDVYNEFGDLRQIHRERTDRALQIVPGAPFQRIGGIYDEVKPPFQQHPNNMMPQQSNSHYHTSNHQGGQYYSRLPSHDQIAVDIRYQQNKEFSD